MTDEKKDPPIEEAGFIGGVNVVQFGDVRVARGLSRRPFSMCPHTRLMYDSKERRIWCKDCERDVEAFDAFEQLVSNLDKGWKALEHHAQRIEEAEKHSLISIAAKVIDTGWRKKALSPCCPHCNGVLLPDDFKSGIKSFRSTELERARRKRLAKDAEAKP